MKKGYVLKTLAIFASALFLVYSGFAATNFIRKGYLEDNLTPIDISYSKQKGPAKNMVQVKISVKNDLSLKAYKIAEVRFNKELIPFKNRKKNKIASAFMHLKPGQYQLSWKMKNKLLNHANFTKYSKEIKIAPSDMLVHIQIEGTRVIITN